MTCWINTSNNGTNSHNIVEKLLSEIRTAKTSDKVKKAMFDLAFYTQFTDATSVSDFTLMDWGFTVAWLIGEGYSQDSFIPKFAKPQW